MLPKEMREEIRKGQFKENTSGLCRGFIQGNLVILPRKYASDFRLFCDQNPGPCPVLSISEPGDPFIPQLGTDIDIRTDVPEYHVFINGKLADTVYQIKNQWQDDFVTFILGCSFSFEDALIENGINIRNVELKKNVSMYQTNMKTERSKYFSGNYVVSMRPLLSKDIDRAIEITSRYSKAHGAPVHIGSPNKIGINNLAKPDFGDAIYVFNDEVPVFWACGVTPQLAIMEAKIPIAITHVPGKMLITDKRYEDL